jgi:hypothetical protein
LPHLCGVIGALLLSYSPLFGGGVFFVGGLFQPTLRILSEMPQAQALAKPDFISERIQLNEARLGC